MKLGVQLPADPALLTDEQNVVLAGEIYERWNSGENKSPLEVECFDKTGAHGKFLTGYFKKWLNKQTERKSKQSLELERLEDLLRVNGISPTVSGDLVEGKEICRIDIPALSAPTWSAASKGDSVLYERLPNSTRAVPTAEIEDFFAERFGAETTASVKETTH